MSYLTNFINYFSKQPEYPQDLAEPNSFEGLPNELVKEIFSHLDIDKQISLRLVSKRCKSLADDFPAVVLLSQIMTLSEAIFRGEHEASTRELDVFKKFSLYSCLGEIALTEFELSKKIIFNANTYKLFIKKFNKPKILNKNETDLFLKEFNIFVIDVKCSTDNETKKIKSIKFRDFFGVERKEITTGQVAETASIINKYLAKRSTLSE